MIRNLLLLFFGLLSFDSLRAQQAANPLDTAEFHYREGAYGYRAEAQLMDSLAILEMMGELTATEVQQEQDKFRKAKKDKQRAKKEKMRKQRKKEKNQEKQKKS